MCRSAPFIRTASPINTPTLTHSASFQKPPTPIPTHDETPPDYFLSRAFLRDLNTSSALGSRGRLAHHFHTLLQVCIVCVCGCACLDVCVLVGVQTEEGR